MAWLDMIPILRSRKALAEATRKLQTSASELDALRAEALRQQERLARIKEKRRRLERRLHERGAVGPARPLLVFEHIPKTAGTTFRRSYLTAALPSEERWILAGGERNERDRERFLSQSPTARARIRIVAGHDADAMRPHLPEARFITRGARSDQRAISSYLHARFHEGGGEALAGCPRTAALAGAVRATYIPTERSEPRSCSVTTTKVSTSIRSGATQERYALVGYTEAFDEFVYLLHEIEGLPLVDYGNRLVRPERESYVPPVTDLDAVGPSPHRSMPVFTRS